MSGPGDVIKVHELPPPETVSDLGTVRSLLVLLHTNISTLTALVKELQGTIQGLNDQVASLRAENEVLKRKLFGKSSERKPRAMPRISDEVNRRRRDGNEKSKLDADRERTKEEPEEVARRQGIPVVTEVHEVPSESEQCPACGGSAFTDMGEGDVSYEWEHIPEHIVLKKHIRRKRACRCRGCVLTAPAPPRVGSQALYGPGMHAAVVVAKCAESMPLYRQSQRYERAGVMIARSTLCSLFHRAASELRPLYDLAMKQQKHKPYLNGDETVQPVWENDKTRNGYMWVFVSEELLLYIFSPSRSGEVPKKLLSGTTGSLQADAHTGYNSVCDPDGRVRLGCMSHIRRKFFEAQPTASAEAKNVLDLITDLYVIERKARDLGIEGTPQHLALRQAESRPVMERLHALITEQRPLHSPKSPMGRALTYALNQWKRVLPIFDDARLYLDNNVSERALRIIAKGRDNFLWVGHDEAGESLAIHQTFTATCQLHGVNPYEWYKDVLIRIQTHPQSRIAELLPSQWKTLYGRPPNDQPTSAVDAA